MQSFTFGASAGDWLGKNSRNLSVSLEVTLFFCLWLAQIFLIGKIFSVVYDS
ncbi:MAG: hypothetical protein ACLBM1_07205 [Cuspidothrix sp.]